MPAGMFVGVDARIDPFGSCGFAADYRIFGSVCRSDVGIAPYAFSLKVSNMYKKAPGSRNREPCA